MGQDISKSSTGLHETMIFTKRPELKHKKKQSIHNFVCSEQEWKLIVHMNGRTEVDSFRQYDTEEDLRA